MNVNDIAGLHTPLVVDQMKNRQTAVGSQTTMATARSVPHQVSQQNIDKKSALYEQCVEFESLFVNIMLKAMRDTLNKEDDLLDGGQAEEIFTDMLYSEYAKSISKNSNLGLADAVYLELVRGSGATIAKS